MLKPSTPRKAVVLSHMPMTKIISETSLHDVVGVIKPSSDCPICSRRKKGLVATKLLIKKNARRPQRPWNMLGSTGLFHFADAESSRVVPDDIFVGGLARGETYSNRQAGNLRKPSESHGPVGTGRIDRNAMLAQLILRPCVGDWLTKRKAVGDGGLALER